MSDPNDNKPTDTAPRGEDLLAAIRAALAGDASDDAKAGAASAARAILRGLEPQQRGAAHPAVEALAGTPLGAALGAIGSIPREQVLALLVGGLRSLLAPPAPAYRTRPTASTPPGGGDDHGSP